MEIYPTYVAIVIIMIMGYIIMIKRFCIIAQAFMIYVVVSHMPVVIVCE